MWATEYTNFAPRLGLAYRMTDTLVIRGGYGISYLPTNTGLNYGPDHYGSGPGDSGAPKTPLARTPAGAPIGTMENPAVSPRLLSHRAQPRCAQIYGYQIEHPAPKLSEWIYAAV